MVAGLIIAWAFQIPMENAFPFDPHGNPCTRAGYNKPPAMFCRMYEDSDEFVGLISTHPWGGDDFLTVSSSSYPDHETGQIQVRFGALWVESNRASTMKWKPFRGREANRGEIGERRFFSLMVDLKIVSDVFRETETLIAKYLDNEQPEDHGCVDGSSLHLVVKIKKHDFSAYKHDCAGRGDLDDIADYIQRVAIEYDPEMERYFERLQVKE